ncbi:MAG: RNA methyltransferase [Elainellaceae cyanobacterium]
MKEPEDRLAAIRLVLVEPSGALNIGSIARVMKNMGLSQWVVVQPHCDIRGEDAQRMAVHAWDLLDQLQVVATLPEALVGCQRAIATTGRDDYTDVSRLEHPRQALPWLLEGADQMPPVQSALIFGPEDRGLSNTELNYAQRWVQIPSSDRYRSLNLAQAVAVCCYELYQLAGSPETSLGSREAIAEPAASLDALERYYQTLEDLLLRIGYLYPHTAESRMAKVRRLLNRAYPSSHEVSMLHGVLRQVHWAIAQAAIQSAEKKSD